MAEFKTDVEAADGLHDIYGKLKSEISKVIIGLEDIVRLL